MLGKASPGELNSTRVSARPTTDRHLELACPAPTQDVEDVISSLHQLARRQMTPIHTERFINKNSDELFLLQPQPQDKTP